MNESAHFNFKEIYCPVCEANTPKFLDCRGGEANHNSKGEKIIVSAEIQ